MHVDDVDIIARGGYGVRARHRREHTTDRDDEACLATQRRARGVGAERWKYRV